MNSLSRIWDIPLLLLLSLIWASAFTMIKIAVPMTGPVLLVLIRCGIGAAVMLVILALLRGASWPKTWRQWIGLIVLGIISTAVPFYLISFAEQKITSADDNNTMAAITSAETSTNFFAPNPPMA